MWLWWWPHSSICRHVCCLQQPGRQRQSQQEVQASAASSIHDPSNVSHLRASACRAASCSQAAACRRRSQKAVGPIDNDCCRRVIMNHRFIVRRLEDGVPHSEHNTANDVGSGVVHLSHDIQASRAALCDGRRKASQTNTAAADEATYRRRGGKHGIQHQRHPQPSPQPHHQSRW